MKATTNTVLVVVSVTMVLLLSIFLQSCLAPQIGTKRCLNRMGRLILYQHTDGNATEIREKPEFSIMSFSNKPVYDPGEGVLIELYIAGSELVGQSRLICHIPKYLVKNDTVEITAFRFVQIGEGEVYKPVVPPQKLVLGHRFVAVLTDRYFTYPTAEEIVLWSAGVIIDNETGRQYAPVSILFEVDKDAPGGDHVIQFQFKYMPSDGIWLVTKDTLNIHISTWIERNAFRLTPTVSILLTGITIVLAWARSALGSWIERHKRVQKTAVALSVIAIVAVIVWALLAFR